MSIQQEREFLQELLESGKLDSLSVQVIALNRFAESIGYKAVNGDIRRGFKTHTRTFGWSFKSLQYLQSIYNGLWFETYGTNLNEHKIVERIGLQYNKKLGKLTTQKHWLKFVKES
jgi:hypothetical protein